MHYADSPHRSTAMAVVVGLFVLLLSPSTVTAPDDPHQATTSSSVTSALTTTATASTETPPVTTSTTTIPSHTPSTASATASITPSVSASAWLTIAPSASSTVTVPGSPIPESLTPSFTTTETPTSQPTSPPVPTGTVLINEVAWAGTMASSSDEWIELFNPGADSVSLEGWTLDDGNDLTVSLSGTLPPFGYYLLERSDDTTVADVAADRIYSGNLHNGGDTLWLRDPSGAVVDSANQAGGGWPAGEAASRASMERIGGDDAPGNWTTWNGLGAMAHDADGNLIHGTPRSANSMYYPTPTHPVPTPTGSIQPSGSQTPSPQATNHPPGSVLINEVAWAGTRASSSDEWIELMNTTDGTVELTGWTLSDGGDLQINLSGSIAAHGFYLLERSDDTSVADVAADFIYGGTLNNSGEHLRLLDSSGTLIDSANQGGGGWPAGDSSQRYSMERRGGNDSPGNWSTFTGFGGISHDAAGSLIGGTPRQPNSIFFPTPSPTWVPGRIVINEILIRPHYDWEGTGGATTADEFIELYNSGPYAVNLEGWILDDVPEAGSRPYILPGFTLPPNGYLVLFRSRTHLALNDSGDTVRLSAPNGMLIDKVRYLRVRAYNLSFGRLPNGSNQWQYGLWPTPGRPNLVFIDPSSLPPPSLYDACPTVPSRRLVVIIAGRFPSIEGWFGEDGHFYCPRRDTCVREREGRWIPLDGYGLRSPLRRRAPP